MTTLRVIKSIGRSRLRLALLLIPLLLACFAIAQSARAVTPEADDGNANSTMAEEGNALLDLRADTKTSAMGQQQSKTPPNHPERRIDFRANPGQCAPEMVELHGLLKLHFQTRGLDVVPKSANFKEFSGTGIATGRTYVAREVHVERSQRVKSENGVGAGCFILEFQVIGNPNPPPKADPNPGRAFRFTVSYKVLYGFAKSKVKGGTLNLGDPNACCNVNGCLEGCSN